MNIGILNPGKMGIAVARTMIHSGHEVYWASAGRSPATRNRAESAGLHELASAQEMAQTCAAIVCVCPPHAAHDVADLVINTGFQGVYLDANAIAPRTAREIGAKVTAAGITFIDGGIIGLPPTERGTSWLYLSGSTAESAVSWFNAGPLEVEVVGPEIGSASGLKMCYAANTKGYNALTTAIMGAAEEFGVRDALEKQWERHWPGFAEKRKNAAVSVAYNKAWRFAGEMEEMEKAWADAGIPNGFFTAAAEVYHRIGHLRHDTDEPSLEKVLQAVKKDLLS